MVKLREKIVLKYQGTRYVVQSLENRIEPRIGLALAKEDIDKLLLEAKVSGALTVKVI